MDDTPNGIALFLICLGVISAFVVFLWAVNYLKGWRPAHISSVKHSQEAPTGTPRVMSRSGEVDQQAVSMVPLVPLPGTWLDVGELAHNLTEAQLLEVLALARDAKGKYRYSGKKIYALVGGNHGMFLATMRQLRGDEKDEMPEEPAVLTPIAGRPTKASYYQDPDLEFQPPPR